MPEFVLESRTRAGVYLATLPFRNLQGEFFLNKPKQIRWEMPLRGNGITQSQFFPGITEVILYRDGTKIFTGPVWDATVSSKDNKFSCAAESIESYLWQRRIETDRSYTATFGQIAWNLINSTQALTDGGLGITQGTLVSALAPSGTVKYAMKEGIIIGDEISDNLSSGDNGFDWEITPNRVFNEYYPRLTGRANVRLEYGGNITGYSLQVMGKYEANNVIIKGADATVSTQVIDTTKRAQYGLRHYVGSNTALKTVTLLNAYASLTLKRRRDARIVPQVSVKSPLVNPLAGDMTYGQIAPLVIDDGWTQFSQDMRLDGFQLTVGKHGEETFVLYLNDMREVT